MRVSRGGYGLTGSEGGSSSSSSSSSTPTVEVRCWYSVVGGGGLRGVTLGNGLDVDADAPADDGGARRDADALADPGGGSISVEQRVRPCVLCVQCRRLSRHNDGSQWDGDRDCAPICVCVCGKIVGAVAIVKSE